LRFEPRRGGKTSKSQRIDFAERNERFREPRRKSLKSRSVRSRAERQEGCGLFETGTHNRRRELEVEEILLFQSLVTH
jgi:hypothetical protein